MHLIHLLLFIGNLYSKTIEVNYRYQNYKIDYAQNLISYKTNTIDLSLKIKECNEAIIKDFKRKMDLVLSEDSSSVSADKQFIIKVDGKTHYVGLDSNQSEFFKNFDTYFKTLKVQEMLSCKNKK